MFLHISFPVRRIAAFLLGLLCIVAILEFQLRRNLPSPEARKYRELWESHERIDTIILGSSTTIFGVDPRPLAEVLPAGESIFNFGISGSKMSFQKNWYDQLYRFQRPAPKTVLIGVDWFSFGKTRNLRRIEHDSRMLPLSVLWRLFWQKDSDHGEIIVSSLHFFILHNIRSEILNVFVPKLDFENARLDLENRGFLPSGSVAEDSELMPPIAADDAKTPEELAAFDALLGRMKDEGARIIVFDTPQYLPGLVFSEDDTAVRDILKRHNVPFLDYNTQRSSSLNTTKSLFADRVHLNASGAALFSDMLARDIRAVLAN